MMSSQDSLARLDEARRGIRSALDALGKIPDEAVPRVTNDGIQHELQDVEKRLQVVRDDLAPAGKQTSSDQE
ncbi:MAG: hypothetical protein M3Z20_10070 [Chloroflexota bacterium]|nr:hypothetical protein [Chloroflexota bacterium]